MIMAPCITRARASNRARVSIDKRNPCTVWRHVGQSAGLARDRAATHRGAIILSRFLRAERQNSRKLASRRGRRATKRALANRTNRTTFYRIIILLMPLPVGIADCSIFHDETGALTTSTLTLHRRTLARGHLIRGLSNIVCIRRYIYISTPNVLHLLTFIKLLACALCKQNCST